MNERIIELETKQESEYPHVSVEFKLEEVADAGIEDQATATLTIKNTVDNCSVDLPFSSSYEIEEFIAELQNFVKRHQSAWEIG